MSNVLLLLIYVINGLLVWLWSRTYKKKDGEREWLLAIGVLFPLIGLLVCLLLVFFQKRFGSQQGYIPYERFPVNNYQVIQVVSLKERESLPFVTGVQSENDELGKDLVYRLVESNVQGQGKYMRKAIHATNTETVHYAATGFQVLGRKYEGAIRELSQEVKERPTLANYETLLSVYREYLGSELVPLGLLDSRKRQYESLLEQALEEYDNHYPFYEAYGKWLDEQQTDTLSYWEEIRSLFPEEVESYARVAIRYYHQGQMTKLKKLLAEVEGKFDQADFPEEVNYLLSVKRGGLRE